ncbi:PRC-barrel domain-containing protein [Jannaschia sp. W003]|uniref:PRC-barrel domain-containing protein n=1 Tax=Jannaschia sp. W003 TaxID=2867012 RepID=UPI0021A82BEC|nr:PRC-barrel domain-containing protein [Jannaschia sp. W003]UWQ22139.1 PRC-barrel domain-containing protein [Jannaschia sp. W003]
MTPRPLLALALALAPGAALADAHAMDPFAVNDVEYGERYLATTLIGTRVHVVDQEIDPTVPLPAGTVEGWDDIGEIGDLIIGVDGTLEAVVVDVGGFLGMGERQVAVRWDALRGVREEDDEAEYFLGLNTTKEALEAAPEVEREKAE